jgi:hypothetical protein
MLLKRNEDKDSKRLFPKNKKGQQIMIGIVMMVMAMIVFISFIPAMSDIFDIARQCDNLNCEGYVDIDATSGSTCSSTNRTYQSSGNENTFSCTALDLGIPYVVLTVIIGLVSLLLAGKMSETPQYAPQYSPQYGGY